MPDHTRVGCIGLGRMGSPMAERLRMRRDVSLCVHDANPDATAAFAGLDDADVVASVGEIADRCEFVLLSLPSPAALESVVDDIARSLDLSARQGPSPIVINTSTTDIASSERCQSLLHDAGAAFVDAPISGGETGAENGTLTLIVSGDPGAKNDSCLVFQTIGQKCFDVGDRVGQAQAVKAANNFLGLTALMLTAEAVSVLSDVGIPVEQQLEIFNASSGANTATLTKYPDQVLSGRFDFGFSVDSVVKDLQMFLDVADHTGIDVPLARTSRDRWSLASDLGWATSDCTRIGEFVRRSDV